MAADLLFISKSRDHIAKCKLQTIITKVTAGIKPLFTKYELNVNIQRLSWKGKDKREPEKQHRVRAVPSHMP